MDNEEACCPICGSSDADMAEHVECLEACRSDVDYRWLIGVAALESNLDEAIVQAYVNYIGPEYIVWEDLSSEVEEAFLGVYNDIADYAYQLAEDMGEITNERLMRYIDWEEVGNDYENSGDIWTVRFGNRVWVFQTLS